MEKKFIISQKLKEFINNNFNGNAASLARAMGIAPQTLQKYLNGERELGHKMLPKLAELGCDINWLLTGKKTLDLIKEKNEIYNAESETLKKLREEMKELKALLFDLQREKEKLILENKQKSKERATGLEPATISLGIF